LKNQDNYSELIGDISIVLESARKSSARSINKLLTTAYWIIGRRIVEFEYQGMDRSEYYGDRLIEKLAGDLSPKHVKGFSKSNLFLMKNFYLAYSNIFQTLSGKSFDDANISQTVSGKSYSNIVQTLSAQSFKPESSIPEKLSRTLDLFQLLDIFPLPWSHYVRLLSVKNKQTRTFYESEALRGGLSLFPSRNNSPILFKKPKH